MNLLPKRALRWHLRNIGLIFLGMYGWAFFTDDKFFDLSGLATRFLAFLLVAAIYAVGIWIFKFGPPPEFMPPDEDEAPD